LFILRAQPPDLVGRAHQLIAQHALARLAHPLRGDRRGAVWGIERLRDTIRGHEVLLTIARHRLADAEDSFDRECGPKISSM
jgi:hypothetical protein